MRSRFLARLVLASAVSIAAAAATAAPEVPPEAVLATLPFLDVDEPNRIYVDLAPDGAEPFRLMLGIGSTYSVFTPLAARRAGISVRAIKSDDYRRATRLGRDLQFRVDTQSSDTGSKTGWEYGFLGGNFLADYVLEIDFTMERVRFIDPKRYSVPEQVSSSEDVVLPLPQRGRRAIIDVSIDGKAIPATLETGTHVPLILSGDAARKVGIDVESLQPFGTYGSALGPVEIRLAGFREVDIGGLRFRDVPVIVAPKGWYNLAGESSDTMLGFDLLSRFLVRLDYAHERVLLRRESEVVPYMGVDASLTRTSGAFLAPWPSAYLVEGVVADSPAAKLGLRPGDLIQRTPDVRTPEKVLRGIAASQPLMVVRDEDGILADVQLPAGDETAAK